MDLHGSIFAHRVVAAFCQLPDTFGSRFYMYYDLPWIVGGTPDARAGGRCFVINLLVKVFLVFLPY